MRVCGTVASIRIDDRAILPEIKPLQDLGFPSLNIDLEKIDDAVGAMQLQQIRQRHHGNGSR